MGYRKANKLKEIFRAIDEEIEPKMQDLKNQVAVFHEWIRLQRQLEIIQKLVAALEYNDLEKSRDNGKKKLETTEVELNALQDEQKNLHAEIEKSGKKIEESQIRLQNIDLKDLEENYNKLNKEYAIADVKLQSIRKRFQDEVNRQEDLKSKDSKNQERLKTSQAELVIRKARLDEVQLAYTSCDQELMTLKQNLTSMNAGMESGEDGMSIKEKLMHKEVKFDMFSEDLAEKTERVTVNEKKILHLKQDIKK